MIYDGDCNFCKFWITRWQQSTAGKVDYLPSQDPQVPRRFPGLTAEMFATAVQFIETDGRVYSGAEAVFRSLIYSPAWSWLLGLYKFSNIFARATEWAYHLVAKRRETFSFLTRLLWGRDGALPKYHLVRRLFLAFLGLIYLSAFVSLGTQLDGLVGGNGILPAKNFMAGVRQHVEQNHIGLDRYHMVPTLCWFSASDGFLHFLCAAGAVLALVLISGLAPAPCLFLLWLIYLSLSVVCRDFLSFQWDTLLLETGFLAIFLAPLQLWPRRATTPPPSRVALWLLRWLLFRLMFESGMVKLASGDPAWRHLTALTFHYETQPLPTWIGWYAHQLPAAVHRVCAVLMFAIELVVPFFILLPRRVRFLACALFVLLQAVILLTGNYCFFNFLAIALCLLLLDDAFLQKFLPVKFFKKFSRRALPTAPPQETSTLAAPLENISVPPAPQPAPAPRKLRWSDWITVPLAAVILLVTVPEVLELVSPRPWPALNYLVYQWVSPFRSINSYGLFAVMTTERLEIIVEGSDDGLTWLPYEFKYKPGDPQRRPQFVAPHQPRLDWQMWFAALGTVRENRWFANFCVKLLEGSPPVLALLEKNPFPQKPPRHIRAQLYQYHFTTPAERRATGAWWRRDLKAEYIPSVSLK